MPWWVKDFADGWIEYPTREAAHASQEAKDGALVLQGPHRPVQAGHAYVMQGEPPEFAVTHHVVGDAAWSCPFCFVTDPGLRAICARCIERDAVQAQIAALEARLAKLEAWLAKDMLAARVAQNSHGYPKDSISGVGDVPWGRTTSGLSDW